jgi:hypothetical protein
MWYDNMNTTHLEECVGGENDGWNGLSQFVSL